MKSLVIRDVIEEHKLVILEEMNRLLNDLPTSPYQEFLLRTEVGRHRLATWVDLIIGALDGNVDCFLEDQKDAGYQRAIQGFLLDNVSMAYQAFLESCLVVAQKVLPSPMVNGAGLIDEFNRLTKLCLKGHSAVAASFLMTREEIIREKVTALQQLLDFTRQIVTTFDVGTLIELAGEQISSIFEAEVVVKVHRNGRVYRSDWQESEDKDPEVTSSLKMSLEKASLIFVDQHGNLSADVDRFQTKHIISAPIGAQGRVHGALALVNRSPGMGFSQKELDLLLQFVYIVAMALDNAFMVEEIKESRGELRLLTRKLITIKEEERRLLAADIHDTLAQALAGIGYKIQYCSEISKTKPDLVLSELETLVEAVHQAIKQCRALISNLRPDLIDTIGLVPALRRLLEDFSLETGVEIATQLPEHVDLSGDTNICLYRVAQEALRNIQRHSDAEKVWIRLTSRYRMAVLEVSDDGKGFDIAEQPPWIKDPNKVGLLYMRQRVDAVGGTLLIDTGPGRGCLLTARIPTERREDSLEKDKDHGG